MAKKEKKERKARKPKEEAPEVEEAPEAEEEQPEEAEEVEEAVEEKKAEKEEAAPKEKATEIASGPKKETEEAEEAPKGKRGFFPGTTRHGGHEMKPQPKLKLDLSPCESLDEAIERVGGEEVVKSSKEYPEKFVVVFGDSLRKAEFPKAE